MAVRWATLSREGVFVVREDPHSLKAMQDAVGGDVEPIDLEVIDVTMWVNEEGKFPWVGLGGDLPRSEVENVKGEWLHCLFKGAPRHRGDFVAGDVCFTGGADFAGETMDLSTEALAVIRAALADVVDVSARGPSLKRAGAENSLMREARFSEEHRLALRAVASADARTIAEHLARWVAESPEPRERAEIVGIPQQPDVEIVAGNRKIRVNDATVLQRALADALKEKGLPVVSMTMQFSIGSALPIEYGVGLAR